LRLSGRHFVTTSVEFLNNWKLDFEHNVIKVMLGEEHKIFDKHFLVEVLKIYHTTQT
jgi:hypothetical protein